MKKTLWILGLLIITGYVLFTALVVVEEDEIVVITQFGRPDRVVDTAGPAWKLPDPVESPIRLDKRLQLLDTPALELLTRDRRNLVVSGFVVWRIADAEVFIETLHNIEAAESRIEDLVNAEMGAAFGEAPLADFLARGDDQNRINSIMDRVTEVANQSARQEFGIEIAMVRPRQLGFPAQNLNAIYQRMMAERQRIEKRYIAEGNEQAAKIRAATEREVRELLAKAYQESQTLRGEGEAEATRIYAQAYTLDPEFYRLTRSMEAYKKIINEKTTIVLSTDSPLFEHLIAPPQTGETRTGAPGQ